MPLPDLTNDWPVTRQALHQAAQVLGAVRAALAPPQPNFLHLGLRVDPGGLTTGPLPDVGEWKLDFASLTLRWYARDRTPVALAVRGTTQQDLAHALEQTMLYGGRPITLDREKIAGDELLHPYSGTAAAYAEALTTIYKALDRLHVALPGHKTPPVVWPHGFDLAFLWFATADETEEAPHMSFGFSPASPGLDRPYLYAYAHPAPAGLTDLPLPPSARWHTAGWTGLMVPYEALAAQDAPEVWIVETMQALFERVAPLLREL